MKKVIRLLCAVLALFVTLQMVPVKEWNIVEEVEAASNEVTVDDVDRIIQEIYNQCNKRYWVGGYGTATLASHADKGDYKFGTNSTNTGGTNSFDGANTCMGFANYVVYAIFKTKFSEQKKLHYHAQTYSWDGTSSGGWTLHNKNLGSYKLKPGDVIGFRPFNTKSYPNPTHKAVIWKTEEDKNGNVTKVTTIEGNIIKYNQINSRTFTMEELYKLWGPNVAHSYVIESPTIICKHSNIKSNGDCEGCPRHFHIYDKDGVCKKQGCNARVAYYYNKKISSGTNYTSNYYQKDAKGNYVNNISSAVNVSLTPTNSKYFNVYNKPYIDSGKVKTKYLLFFTKDLEVNKATAKKQIVNHYGEKWFEITVDGYNSPVYVNYDAVDKKWNSNITITDETYPKNNVVAGKSAATTVKGIIRSENYNLTEVTAAVFDISKLNKTVLANLTSGKYNASQVYSLNAEYKYHETNIKNNYYSLYDHKTFDEKIKFRSLSGNCDYVYVITATDTNGKSKTAYHSFHLKSSSSSQAKYDVIISSFGEAITKSVNVGSSITLPEKDREGMIHLGWSLNEDSTTAEYKSNAQYTPNRNVTLYAIYEEIKAPDVPVLTPVSYDIAQGDTRLISWNAAANADSYKVYVYDESSTKVYEQNSAGTSISVPFENAGTYSIKVEAFNRSYEGRSGESEQAITVRVHEPSTVQFLNYDGTVWDAQEVSYGGSATLPTNPSRRGYEFSGWEGTMSQIYSDTTLTAIYNPIKYKVTFYDANNDAISEQYVTYDGDVPGSAVEPTAPTKENYTFVGWNTGDWQNVTESGVKVYPVYVWSNENVPLTIDISDVTTAGEGYWVSYTVTNHLTDAQTGRVIIAGKTAQGKFITQTESGAFYLAGGEGSIYTTSVYLPVNSYDLQTLATVEAYVVDNYTTKKPIAQPDIYSISSIDGEYSGWMTAEELAALDTSTYSTVESKTQYRKKEKETITTTTPTYLDWTLEQVISSEGEWSNWSAWQDDPITATENMEVKTQQVQLTAAHTEYRYGRYVCTNNTWAKNDTKAGYWRTYSDNAANNMSGGKGTWVEEWSPWYTVQKDPKTYMKSSKQGSNGKGVWSSSLGMYRWDVWEFEDYQYTRIDNDNNIRSFWEQTRTVEATYKTQYSYRTRQDVYQYVFSHWTDFSEWSDNVYTESDTQIVETRPMYRVKLVTSQEGSSYTFSGEVGAAGEGKEAILNVYKVDEASDYSNQYIEQATLGTNGAYSFTFDTLEVPSVQTGDYTVTLTIEGATESLYIGTIEAPKPQYTVQFVDEVTGLEINTQTVSEGSSATAPEVPEHDGYYFLGWEYGLGNIREDMRINARYVKKLFTVVFVDPVNMSVTMVNEIPYGTKVEAPEVNVLEGYNFIGWTTDEGMSLDEVTGHMIVTAEFERVTNIVSYMNYSGAVLEQQIVNYGEYADNPISSFETPVDTQELIIEDTSFTQGLSTIEADESSEEQQYITEDDLGIPENMYFAGWSEGSLDPVTQDITITPIVLYYDDVKEIYPSLEEGLYVGTQTVTLKSDAEDTSDLTLKYRLSNLETDTEGDWITYDLSNPEEIEISETLVLEIYAQAEDKNSYTASYEYVIASQSEVPAVPTSVSAEQANEESVEVNWNSVSEADGYIVKRVSDCDEESQYVVEDLSFTDYDVDPLRTYTYQVSSFVATEIDGANVVLESENSESDDVFFFGENTPVTSVEVEAPQTAYLGSAVQLTANVSPDDAYDATVSWTCTAGTGDGYVTDDGLFYGLSAGTVTVTAKATDGSGVSNSIEIIVIEIDDDTVTLTVDSSTVRAGSSASVSVSISENSMVETMQFALLYDPTVLTLTSYEAGEAIKNLGPTISNPEEGLILFNWDSLTAFTAGGSLLDLKFDISSEAEGITVIEIPTDNDEYDFIFTRGNEMTQIDVASINGALDIKAVMLGDVDENERVNIIDANLVRRFAARMVELTDTQLMAADVNGDGKYNIIDANLIRRYVARLIDQFPIE